MEKVELLLIKLQAILDEAIEDSNANLNEFLNSKIFKIGKFIGIYHEILKALQVDCNDDLKDSLDVNLYNKLERFLANWNLFLNEVETKYNDASHQETSTNDSYIPIEMQENADSFIELNANNGSPRRVAFKEFCKNIQKKHLVLVLLRHFA